MEEPHYPTHRDHDEQTELSTKIQLPSDFMQADRDHLVVLIVDMLDRLIAHNDQIPLSAESLTRFHSRCPPSISLMDYVCRIVKYTKVERSCLLITLHYIDQICARTPAFTITSLTVHRFLITSIAISSKALCDAFCTNTHYAKVGGIRVAELNLLEREFLSQIEWRLTCTRELLDTYYVNLVRTHSAARYVLMDPPPHQMDTEEVEEVEIQPEISPPTPINISTPTDDRSRATTPSDTTTTTTLSASHSRYSHSHPHQRHTSTGLLPTQSEPPAPQPATMEQNMAFVYLMSSASGSGTGGEKRSASGSEMGGVANRRRVEGEGVNVASGRV